MQLKKILGLRYLVKWAPDLHSRQILKQKVLNTSKSSGWIVRLSYKDAGDRMRMCVRYPVGWLRPKVYRVGKCTLAGKVVRASDGSVPEFRRWRLSFLTCEIEFVLFLAVLTNSVVPMGWDTGDTKSDVKCLQTLLTRPKTPQRRPNGVRWWSSYNVNCKYSFKIIDFSKKRQEK